MIRFVPFFIAGIVTVSICYSSVNDSLLDLFEKSENQKHAQDSLALLSSEQDSIRNDSLRQAYKINGGFQNDAIDFSKPTHISLRGNDSITKKIDSLDKVIESKNNDLYQNGFSKAKNLDDDQRVEYYKQLCQSKYFKNDKLLKIGNKLLDVFNTEKEKMELIYLTQNVKYKYVVNLHLKAKKTVISKLNLCLGSISTNENQESQIEYSKQKLDLGE